MEYSAHKGPEDQERERITDWDMLIKKVRIDLYNEKLRQQMRNLPQHEQIKLMKKIMNEQYGIYNKKI